MQNRLYNNNNLISIVPVSGRKNIWGPGPSSLGRQQRLSEISR